MNRRKFLRTAGACLAGHRLACYASGFEKSASMDAASDAVTGTGKRPPMRMYVDDHLAYSCNEPTINCNAPLVFALAATLNQH